MYFIDVQGTLISDSDKTPLNGACELIAYLNKKALPYCVITNNTKFQSAQFLGVLRDLGLEIKDGAYLDPFCVLDEILKPTNVALFGASEFKATMKKLGFSEDLNAPKAVIIASGCDFSFDEFASMIELIQKGAKLIAMHETSIYKKHGRLYPGVGAICKMLQYATSAQAIAVGKPSFAYYQKAKELIRARNFNEISIISDDAKGDLIGAKELGMKTILVLSGKIKSLESTGVDPKLIDAVYSDVNEFLQKELK